jgi:transposase InsO family protein
MSRAALYYKHLKPAKDKEFLYTVKQVMNDHPSYGTPRVALELGVSKNKVARIKQKHKLVVARKKAKVFIKPKDQKQPAAKYENLLKNLVLTKADQAYASDFTYLKYRGKHIYLATVIDLYTREIKGFEVADKHKASFTLRALCSALFKTKKLPEIIHSDQGSEYKSKLYTDFASNQGIKISMSAKASPWQNGVQESFYASFKTELGEINRFETKAHLIEAIYQTIYYYNHKRIHTKLKMSPYNFAKLAA